MSEPQVDLSQIRGDWKFHIDYLTNAVTQTLKRQENRWRSLDASIRAGGVDEAVESQQQLWGKLIEGSDDAGTIPLADDRLTAFIDACRSTREVCNAVLDKSDALDVEEFSEACRQARALCDDLEMMRDQRPGA